MKLSTVARPESHAAPRPAPVEAALSSWVARRARRLAALLVASTLAGVWLVSGVPPGDVTKFVAFEALYVVLPGCLLYALLSPASWSLSPTPGGRLCVLAIGWPLGYALEIGAFALTAGLHARGAFAFLPLLAAATLGPGVLYRRRSAHAEAARGDGVPRRGLLSGPGGSGFEGSGFEGRGSEGRGSEGRGFGVSEYGLSPRGSGAEPLLAAGAIAIALLLLAFRFFATYPLPEHAGSVFYFVDNVWDVSLSAEALHHWPVAEPYLVGHALRYYIGAFLHVAAVKQVMGVPIAVTIFRLLPTTSTVVAMLQFWCLGGLLGRSRWAGPVTVALLVVVENMKLFPTHTKVFGVALFSEFTWSPTYGLGVVFLLGLLILFRSRFLGMGEGGPSATRSVAPGAAGSLLMLGVLVLGAGAVKSTVVATFVAGMGLYWLWVHAPRTLWRPAGARGLTQPHFDRLLTCALALSLACFVLIYLLLLAGHGAPAATEIELDPLHFLKYTVFASTLAAHPGLAPQVGAAVVISLWKLLPVAGALWLLWRRSAWSSYASFALAVFVVGFTVYVTMGSVNDGEIYFIWYGYIALIPVAAVSLMILWNERRPLALALKTSTRVARVTVGCILLLGALGGAESLALAVPDAWRTIMDRQVVPRDSESHPGITAALYRGLTWVRGHTGTCDILAVNTHDFRPAGATSGTVDSGYYYYSAFTERQVFFESWIMTTEALRRAQPYPALYALNSAATLHGSPAALRELARRGVSYVLIDKVHGGTVREPPSVSRLVYANSALDVYRLTVPVGPHGC